jgi:Domain of unknown function (DUF4258)
MHSQRFKLDVVLTRHAELRMVERSFSEAELLDLIDTGEVKYKDDTHLWIYKAFKSRNDNLLCAAAVIEGALVIKTLMHHFTPEV